MTLEQFIESIKVCKRKNGTFFYKLCIPDEPVSEIKKRETSFGNRVSFSSQLPVAHNLAGYESITDWRKI